MLFFSWCFGVNTVCLICHSCCCVFRFAKVRTIFQLCKAVSTGGLHRPFRPRKNPRFIIHAEMPFCAPPRPKDLYFFNTSVKFLSDRGTLLGRKKQSRDGTGMDPVWSGCGLGCSLPVFRLFPVCFPSRGCITVVKYI